MYLGIFGHKHSCGARIVLRVLLVVAYDGTEYHGWQVQPNEPQTIEGVLNRTISSLTGETIEVIGASRTDAGVHAMGNLAVFDTDSSIPATSFVKALNGKLPTDIRIMDSYEVKADFHPRHMDMRKTYRYRLYHGDILPPCERLYAHHIYGPLNAEAMRNAAMAFVGEHDFAAFCAAGSQALTTVRTIYDCHIEITKVNARTTLQDEYIDIFVTGSGFLYNMVRIIAGTLLAVGRGQIKAEDIAFIIESKDRSKAGPTLPAQGLRLEGYEKLL